MKKHLIRTRRYLLFLAQYLLYEKPKGLDFTMRDTAICERSNGKYHGYSKTSERHLKEIFERIQNKEALCFLDIGCGKGVVLKEAAKYPFQRVDGIEIQPHLVKTAQKNFRILKIEERIRCFPADAARFEKYGDYNLFFLFNPFPAEILEKVIRKIMESRNDTDCIVTVIYHNPRFLPVIESNAKIIERETLYDPLKDYETCILRMKPIVASKERKWQ